MGEQTEKASATGRPRVRTTNVTPRRSQHNSQNRQRQADKPTGKRATTPLQPARPPADGLWTLEEVRVYLRVGKRKVYDYVHQGLLTGFRAGRGYRFMWADVEALVDRLRASGGAGATGGSTPRRGPVAVEDTPDDVPDDTHPELAAVR